MISIRHTVRWRSMPVTARFLHRNINHQSQNSQSDILSRTKVVVCANESRQIIDDLLSRSSTIAVDFEGTNHKTRLGLVQVATRDKDIFLFRTGINEDLIDKGGIKELLENPLTLKVMHGATTDILAAYKIGIRLWNHFDLSLAHELLQFQRHGHSLFSSKISLNDISKLHNIEQNPMKSIMKQNLWQRQGEFFQSRDIEDDLLLYSAFDVEFLLDLHQAILKLIDNDFLPLLNESHKMEIFRAVEPQLLSMEVKKRKDFLFKDLFLSNLDKSISAIDVYKLFTEFNIYRQVLFSPRDRTAHIIMPDRLSAIFMFKRFSLCPPFNEETQFKLMVPPVDNENSPPQYLKDLVNDDDK